jgi:hypothetical protein
MRYLAATVILIFAACGDLENREVQARNLGTGEVRTFGSEGDVPPGWSVCQDETCSVPPQVPCESLGSEVCTLNPDCRLKILWCSGGATSDSAAAAGSEACETTCIPRLPLLCEELVDQQTCQARPDCQWGQFLCPATGCQEGTQCPACPFSCQARAPLTCDALGEAECRARPDCEWGANSCPVCTGANCPECEPLCQPAALPPCSPTDCGPTTSGKYLCPDGVTWAGPGECVRQPTGKCAWGMVTCPGQAPPPGASACRVTGCNGTLCAAEDKPTTCEWADYYQCYNFAICGLKDGVCGWTETPEFLACMKKHKP